MVQREETLFPLCPQKVTRHPLHSAFFTFQMATEALGRKVRSQRTRQKMLWAGAGAGGGDQSQATLLSPGWVKPEQCTEGKGHSPFLKALTHRFSGAPCLLKTSPTMASKRTMGDRKLSLVSPGRQISSGDRIKSTLLPVDTQAPSRKVSGSRSPRRSEAGQNSGLTALSPTPAHPCPC